MNRARLLLAAGILLLTTLGFLVFPGSVMLYQDTQIWLPMLEHRWDESVLEKDIIATRPHFTYSIYDEVAVLLRRITGAGFEPILIFQQFVIRALGILGVWLTARALQLSPAMSLLAAAVYALGANIAGPSVLTLEYEPVPRGFAGPLVMLAIGLAAGQRWLGAGIAGGAAFLYHPPTAAPFLVVTAALAFVAVDGDSRHRQRYGLLALAGAVAMLFLLARLQPGIHEHQEIFARIDPELEELQRMRAPYNWISMWHPRWFLHYALLWIAGLVAFFRLRDAAGGPLRIYAIGMPLFGMVSIPVSWFLLEKVKWVLIPQIQPARSVLFVTVFAAVLAAAAGVHAAPRRRSVESIVWFFLAYVIPAHYPVMQLLLPDLRAGLIRRRVLLVLGLACLAALAARWEGRRPRLAAAGFVAALLLPFGAIPYAGQVRTIPNLEQPELDQLSAWARQSTPPDAVFLFADLGKSQLPGIFRARALRSVYVDWKSGGQVNIFKGFAAEWWSRWQKAIEPGYQPARMPEYAALGIDFVALSPGNRLPDRRPLYENARYVVYSVRN